MMAETKRLASIEYALFVSSQLSSLASHLCSLSAFRKSAPELTIAHVKSRHVPANFIPHRNLFCLMLYYVRNLKDQCLEVLRAPGPLSQRLATFLHSDDDRFTHSLPQSINPPKRRRVQSRHQAFIRLFWLRSFVVSGISGHLSAGTTDFGVNDRSEYIRTH